MGRFDVEAKLVRGLSAFTWFWLFFGFFLLVLVGSALALLTYNAMSPAVAVATSIVQASGFVLLIPLWAMFFIQRRRENRAGYTTLWAGEEARALDEVDPSTGLVIRVAGDDPLDTPGRQRARAEARVAAEQLVASGAPYVLPFGWRKPRARR